MFLGILHVSPPLNGVVGASPSGSESLLLHLIDSAKVALPQDLPSRFVLLGALLLLQQSTGNGRDWRDRDLLIIRDETLWAEVWC